MNDLTKTTRLLLTIAGLASATTLAGSSHAAVYTVADFTHAVNTTQHFNFTNDGLATSDWTGGPAIDNLTGEDSLYLAFTVSWAASADPGDFRVQYALDDDGGKARADANMVNGDIEVYRSNNDTDGDGAGPATARPLVEINTNTTTSATFVLKVDMTLPSPGGNFNYGTIGEQDEANAFLFVNPNLNQVEGNTVIAGYRGNQNGFDSVSFITTSLAAGGLTFSDIALYTGDDTPFVPEPSSLALLGLGGLLVAGRRRRA